MLSECSIGLNFNRSFVLLQVNQPIKIEREPYTGPVWSPEGAGDQTDADKVPAGFKKPAVPEVSNGMPEVRKTKRGQRDMHASSFSFSGAQSDDKDGHRNAYKMMEPPGGRSSIQF